MRAALPNRIRKSVEKIENELAKIHELLGKMVEVDLKSLAKIMNKPKSKMLAKARTKAKSKK